MLSKRGLRALHIVRSLEREMRKENKYIESEPGWKAIDCYPGFLAELSQGVHSIVVAGTNGKTTVTRILSNILDEAGCSFFTNREGANLAARIVTLFADNYRLLSGPKVNLALIECDEVSLKSVLGQINPEYLLITNIFPDQSSRLVSEEHVAGLIVEAMKAAKPGVCIIQKDCHFKERIEAVEGWKFIEYDDEEGRLRIYGTLYTPKLKLRGSFNVKNAAGAAKLAEQLAIPAETILKGIEETKPAFGRFETFCSGGNEVVLSLTKNPMGFQAVAAYLGVGADDKNTLSKEAAAAGAEENKETKPETITHPNLILAINSGRGDDKNTDWLFESPVAELAKLFATVAVTGDNVPELTKILGESDIIPKEIRFEEIPAYTANAAGGTYILSNYSAMMQIREQFIQNGVLKPYWED